MQAGAIEKYFFKGMYQVLKTPTDEVSDRKGSYILGNQRASFQTVYATKCF
jgi:hypothetical protein